MKGLLVIFVGVCLLFWAVKFGAIGTMIDILLDAIRGFIPVGLMVAGIALIIKGRESALGQAYQLDVKGYRRYGDNAMLGKGKPPLIAMTPEELWRGYLGLWKTWADHHPDLMQELRSLAACRNHTLSDMFAKGPVNQARALAELLNQRT